MGDSFDLLDTVIFFSFPTMYVGMRGGDVFRHVCHAVNRGGGRIHPVQVLSRRGVDHLVRVPTHPWLCLSQAGKDGGRGRHCLVMVMGDCLVSNVVFTGAI